jgi:hypothetical protein
MPGVAAALETVADWQEPDRTDALVELHVLGRFAKDQDELLIRPAYTDLPVTARQRLCELRALSGVAGFRQTR